MNDPKAAALAPASADLLCVMERWRPQRSAQVLHPIKCSGVYTDAEGCYTTPSEHADISLKERKDPDF